MDPWGWTLIIIAVVIIVGFIVFDDDGLFNVFERFGFGLFAALVADVLVFLIFLGTAAYTEETSKEVESHRVPLKSLSDTDETHGRLYGGLFISTGYIDQEAVFRFYGQNDNGSYTLATVTAGYSEVVEGNYPKPYADCHFEAVKDLPKIRGWFLGLNEDHWENANTARWCTFYIPTGTIKDEFALDTK